MRAQYRHGTSTVTALRTLYREGGVVRFYRGLGPALVQGPLSRFGDTASNAGALSLLGSLDATKAWPTELKTVFASATAGAFRIVLMPVDTLKTIMQVEGQKGVPALMAKFRAHGPFVLWHGALGASVATFVGHYPWFYTWNKLQATLPKQDTLAMKLVRNAGIGMVASAVSDTISNSLRVLKTYRQTAAETISYAQAARNVIASEGVLGLFGRGLATRLIANGMQGAVFGVGWKLFESFYYKDLSRN